MQNEQEERAALIAAILPLLEKMPLKWLRVTMITVEKRAARTEQKPSPGGRWQGAALTDEGRHNPR